MRNDILLRLAGAAALAGAALRLNAAFPTLDIPLLSGEPLYFTIDLLLTLGLIGLFAGFASFRTWLGTLGFAGAIGGFLLIRTGERLLGASAYEVASGVLSGSLAVGGLALVLGGWLGRFVGAAWIGAFVVGLAGTLAHWSMGFTIASAAFCGAFALGGAGLIVGRGLR